MEAAASQDRQHFCTRFIRTAGAQCFPSAAHISNIEQPQAFTSAMLGFLERVPA